MKRVVFTVWMTAEVPDGQELGPLCLAINLGSESTAGAVRVMTTDGRAVSGRILGCETVSVEDVED